MITIELLEELELELDKYIMLLEEIDPKLKQYTNETLIEGDEIIIRYCSGYSDSVEKYIHLSYRSLVEFCKEPAKVKARMIENKEKKEEANRKRLERTSERGKKNRRMKYLELKKEFEGEN